MPPEERSVAVTRALLAARQGDPEAAARLFPLVYDDLHGIARSYFERERSGHTLQPTALVHEAFLRLFAAQGAEPLDRAHFLSVAAIAMRRILVEHARARAASKRGGNERRVTLDSRAAIAGESEIDVLALDEALLRLAALDARQARVVELRFFGGLAMDEVAALLGISKRSAEADWTLARTWLHRALS